MKSSKKFVLPVYRALAPAQRQRVLKLRRLLAENARLTEELATERARLQKELDRLVPHSGMSHYGQ